MHEKRKEAELSFTGLCMAFGNRIPGVVVCSVLRISMLSAKSQMHAKVIGMAQLVSSCLLGKGWILYAYFMDSASLL